MTDVISTSAAAETPSSKGDDDERTAGFVLGLFIVALGAALFAIAFRSSLSLTYRLLYGATNVLDALQQLPRWLLVLVPTAGGLVVGLITRSRRSRRQNASNVMEAVALGRVQLSMQTTAIRVAASWSAIAAGMSIGREGPLIEFGGSLGNSIAHRLRLSNDRLRILVAAGTAAGFAAAYNTPFAAVLFVLETMVGIAALEALLPMMTATVVAVTLTRAWAGGGPIYGQREFAYASPRALILFGLLGVLAALAAWAFKWAIALGESAVRRYPVPYPWRPALGGLAVGVIAAFVPQVVGNGSEALNLVLDQRLAAPVLLVLMLAKVAATTSSVSSGVPGGVFTPVLLVGGVVGALWGEALRRAGLGTVPDAGGYALVGMAATTAAMTHAPMTAAVMVFELSGDYPIVVPLLLATIVATVVARGLGSESIYAVELRRRGIAWELTLDGRRIPSERVVD
jgi:CIC family chloride channel protein